MTELADKTTIYDEFAANPNTTPTALGGGFTAPSQDAGREAGRGISPYAGLRSSGAEDLRSFGRHRAVRLVPPQLDDAPHRGVALGPGLLRGQPLHHHGRGDPRPQHDADAERW